MTKGSGKKESDWPKLSQDFLDLGPYPARFCHTLAVG